MIRVIGAIRERRRVMGQSAERIRRSVDRRGEQALFDPVLAQPRLQTALLHLYLLTERDPQKARAFRDENIAATVRYLVR